MKEYKEYNAQMDTLRFTAAQKAAMVDRILEGTQGMPSQQRPATRRMPLRRAAVIGVAAALTLSIGAGATVIYNRLASESFAGVFGTAQTEIIDKIGRPIGATATDAGITITADAIIGDQYNACIVYTIERQDGKALGLPEGKTAEHLLFKDQTTDLRWDSSSHGASWFADDDPADSKVQYVQTISANDSLKKGTATAEFDTLQYYDQDMENVVTLADGNWKIKFDVDYQDASIRLPTGQRFAHDGISMQISNLTVSPVAVRVDYQADGEVDWGDEERQNGREPDQVTRQSERYLGGIAVLVTLKDGTVIDQTDAGGSIDPKNGKTYCTKGSVFDQIIPIEEMESITIGDVVISIG